MPEAEPNAERGRLAEDARREKNWKRWGPYLSERQWGTVREDYSEFGTGSGITFRTNTRAAVHTGGEKTGCWASATARAACASRWRFGTATTPS